MKKNLKKEEVFFMQKGGVSKAVQREEKKEVVCPFSMVCLPLKHTKLIISPPDSEEQKTVPVNFTAFREKASRHGLSVPPCPADGRFNYYVWAREIIKQPGMIMSIIYINDIIGCQMDYSNME